MNLTAGSYGGCGDSYNDCNSCCDPCDIDWCGGWTISADWIYWKARKCDLGYAVSDANGYSPRGKIYGVQPDYQSGFRVAVFKSFCNWDLGVRYTYLRPCDSDHLSGGLYREVAPAYGGILVDGATSAKAKFDLRLDIVDIEMSSGWKAWCDFSHRTFFGVRLSRIDQTFAVLYGGTIPTSIPATDAYKATTDMKAYGLYAGKEGMYDLCSMCDCGSLGLFGSASIGALYASFDQQTYFASAAAGTTPTFDIWQDINNKKNHCLVGNIDLSAGLYYDLPNCFCGNWRFFVGYEFHLWLNVDGFAQLTPVMGGSGPEVSAGYLNGTSNGNLGFDGLFVRASVCF